MFSIFIIIVTTITIATTVMMMIMIFIIIIIVMIIVIPFRLTAGIASPGQPSSCFRAVTGCTVQELWNYSGGVWLQSTMSPDHLNRFQYNSKHRTSVTPGDFWKQLCEHNLQAHLMSAIIDGTEQVRDDGLVEGHAAQLHLEH
eukprot:s8166_g1.t1